MKVSIIIPVFNAEIYISECIESALNQTYKNIEIIAVDDGSTDKSLELLHRYENKIKVISKENGGTATALNAGIKAMSGEWFKWLSADDALYPNAIEELVSATKKINDKKKTILYSSYDIMDSKGKVIKKFIEPNYNDLNLFESNVILLDHFVGNGITSLIHKLALDDYGVFDEKIGFQEDYELWLRFCLLHGCKLQLVPKILAKYRVHEKQLTQTMIGKSLEKADKVRKFVLKKLDPLEREKYEIALKHYKKNKPITVKGRRFLRKSMEKVLPKATSDKILRIYLSRKKTS